jgi:radical SAM superfamily enzyme YgiQ (UPF0313 family)
MTICSYLEKHGISVELIDLKVKDLKILELESPKARELEEKIIEMLKDMRPTMVGMGTFTHEVDYTLSFAKRIKSEINTTIIVGGQHSSLAPEDFIFENSPIDYVVVGEGEETFRELTRAILDQKQGEAFHSIQSISFWEKDHIQKTLLRPLIEPLDNVPMPAYERVDMSFYTQPNPYAIRYFPLASMYVFASRGCPAHCTFCAIPSVWRYNETKKPIRFRSAKAVADEVELLVKKYNVDGIYFYDDDFCVWKSHVIDICKEFIERKIPFVWGAETRVDKVDEELLTWMQKAGCIQIDFGVESGSQAMLDAVNKNCKVEKIHQAFEICHKLGIRTFANMMYNLPGETQEDVRMNQELIAKIKPTTVSFGLMTPYPGSQIYDEIASGKEDYHYFKEAEWKMPTKFVVAKHSLDLDKLVSEDNIRFNSPLQQLTPSTSMKMILRQMARSSRKMDYAKSFFTLGKFLVFDRLPRMIAKNVSPYSSKPKNKEVIPASEITATSSGK